MKILSIVILIITMCSVCSYACDSSEGAYMDSTYWATSSSDTSRVAMINGDKVYYSAMSDKKDNYDPEIFIYIGYGYVYSIYGGVECISDVITCEKCGRDNKVIEHLDK